ncbi:MAG: ABC transporter ATP-binding protein [Oscillospiraceae bacterium]|nr:ABC transporter ATP-binding protein [Oscillospiraceae bacterium]
MANEEYITQMKDPGNVAEFDDLQTCFFTDSGIVRSVDGVSYNVPMGKIVCVVGESGCGKSVTALSLMGLLQKPQGRITRGSIRLNLGDVAYDVAKTPEKIMEKLRGDAVSMIFQEPMTALNPVLRIGEQINEVLAYHRKEKSKEIRRRTLSLLETVGIPDPEGVYRRYPHNLSGGMRQRVCIAMALACRPRLIIADEPTTALDVTIQAQILALLKQLKEETGCAVMLITHDLGVVAEMADLVVVMYAGRIVEQGTVAEIFYQPAHPYTVALMRAKPVVGKRTEQLYAIGGNVPNPAFLPEHCYFAKRCPKRGEDCCGAYPDMVSLSPTHKVSCHLWKVGNDHA